MVPNIAALQARLTNSGTLPAEWICSVVSSALAVYKLYIPAPLMPAEFLFILTVSADGAWILSMGRNQVDRSYCQLMQRFPAHLLSVSDTVNVLSVLDSCRLCIGNDDTKFTSLVDKCNGKFKNHAGSYINLSFHKNLL